MNMYETGDSGKIGSLRTKEVGINCE